MAIIVSGVAIRAADPVDAHPWGDAAENNHGGHGQATWYGEVIKNSRGVRTYIGVPDMDVPTTCGRRYVVSPCSQVNGGNLRPVQIASTVPGNVDFLAVGIFAGCVSGVCSGLEPGGRSQRKQYMDGTVQGSYFFFPLGGNLAIGSNVAVEVSRGPSTDQWNFYQNGTLMFIGTGTMFTGRTLVGVESEPVGTGAQLDMTENYFWGMSRLDHPGGTWWPWVDPNDPGKSIEFTNPHTSCVASRQDGTLLGTVIRGSGRC